MSIGTGTLNLNGTSLQTINGLQTFKTYNLITNNASGFTVNNNLSVSGVHTFTSGIITTSATPNYLVYESGSSYTGDGDNKHVNGWVKKFGSTDFIFPVGNATIERTIALNSLSASSEFNVQYASPQTISAAKAPLLYIDPSEYWNIAEVSGGTALVAMNWNTAKMGFPDWKITDIRVASYNSGGSNWASAGGNSVTGNVLTTGSVISNAVSTFTKFTFGAESFPLPVTLISFTAKYMGNYAAISWTTADEYNVDHFIVERSDDGFNFYSIRQLRARNIPGIQNYMVQDNNPISQVAFYRLRSVDADNKEKLSKTVMISVKNMPAKLLLASNTVEDKIVLLASGNINSVFNYVLVNTAGQLIQSGNLAIQNAGEYDLPINKKPAAGIYFISLINTEQKYSYKILVK
jgi:hypothetical protein